MTKTTTSPPDLEVVARLRLAVMRLARRLRQQADVDITPSMLSVLSTLEGRGPLTLGELADLERVRPPTMTRIVARLEEAELVTKVQDPLDRRVTTVSLNSAGKRLVVRHRGRRTAYLADRLKRLEPAHKSQLEGAVELLERLLED